MVMRYHWGLGVGHIYQSASATVASQTAANIRVCTSELETMESAEVEHAPHPPDHENNSDTEDPELGFENREDDDLGEAEEGLEWDDWHDDELLAMEEMYGISQFNG
jgi:hypothetical protein